MKQCIQNGDVDDYTHFASERKGGLLSMILKLRIGHFRITFTLARVIDVIGVNSKLPDGNHILMWDFDNTPLEKVAESLNNAQFIFQLPKIYILRTSPPDNYIAYCLQRCSWATARAIIAATSYIDDNFYKWGVFRRRFTLRVGPKCGTTPKLVRVLLSKYPEEVTIPELKSWVKYETLDAHHNQTVHRFEVY